VLADCSSGQQAAWVRPVSSCCQTSAGTSSTRTLWWPGTQLHMFYHTTRNTTACN